MSPARLVLVAALALPAVAAVRTDATDATPCGPAKGGNATVRTWCGPARATVNWAGRTLTVKGGACSLQTVAGLKMFAVNTGRYTIPPAKPKSTSFSAAGSDTKPGTYGGWLINFQTPGKQWLFKLLTLKVKILARGAKKGTFSGKLDGGGTATGSWRC